MKTIFNLTKREDQFLKFYGQGKTTGQIADILGLSKRTAENHNRRLRMKLNDSRSTLEALGVARKWGLLDN